MKTLARFPFDLAWLLFLPLIVIAVIALLSNGAFSLFNWMNQPPKPELQQTASYCR